jgi:hypothetical protein
LHKEKKRFDKTLSINTFIERKMAELHPIQNGDLDIHLRDLGHRDMLSTKQ